MIIEYSVPDRDWWQVASVCEQRGTTVTALLDAAFADVLRAVWTPDLAIATYVRAGFPDAEIARRTGMTVNVVADRRRTLKLPANRRHPPPGYRTLSGSPSGGPSS